MLITLLCIYFTINVVIAFLGTPLDEPDYLSLFLILLLFGVLLILFVKLRSDFRTIKRYYDIKKSQKNNRRGNSNQS